MKECCRPSWGRTRNLLITSRTHIQLSHQGWLSFMINFAQLGMLEKKLFETMLK